MKSEDENMDGKPEGKPVKPKKENEQKPVGDVRLPFLLEFTYTISKLILLLLALAIIITSFLAGASLFVIVLRTAIAVIVVGGLLTLIASQISSGLLFAAKVGQEETEKKLNESPEAKPLHSIFDEDQNKAEAS